MEVVRAEADMTDSILALLHRFNNVRLTDEHWKRLLDYPWRGSGESPGLVTVVDGKPVAFLGTVYSQAIGDRGQRLCNMSSWIALPDYPNAGAYLLKELLADESCTLTNLSASPEVAQTLKKLGFTSLDDKAYLSSLEALLRGCSVTAVEGDREGLWNDTAKKIREDHARYDCRHVFLVSGNTHCHVAFSVKPSRLGKLAQIHYVSNPWLFIDGQPALQRYLMKRYSAPRFVVESRFLRGDRLRWAKEVPISPKLYLSRGCRPDQISNLYTEMVILGL